MSGIVVIFLIVAVVASVLFNVMSKRGGSSIQPQPDHFDLLDENGEPIKESKVKIVIGGGDSDAPIQELQYFCIKDKGYHVSVWPKNQGYQGVDYIEFDVAGITHGEHIDDHLGSSLPILYQNPPTPTMPMPSR